MKPDVTSKRINSFLGAIVIVLLTAAAYLPAFHANFIWDDDIYVTDNPLLTAPNGLRRIWFSLDSPSQYFPLVYTTFRIERMFWALNPTGYHAVNVLLHIANALLLWLLLNRLKIRGAWLAAGIFALHPVQAESVAWITERKNVLMGFFFLSSLIAWTAFVADRARQRWLFYWIALLLYSLALFSKSTACTLPAALILIAWLRHERLGWRLVSQTVLFCLLGAGMGLVAVWWEHYHQGTRELALDVDPLSRLLIASHAIWFYLGKLVWPSNLTFIYPRWNVSPGDPAAYVWVLATTALAAVIYFSRRYTGRGVEVSVAFFVATLAPVLGFIMLYTFRYTFVADHYQYIASIGPIALAAGTASTLVKTRDINRHIATVGAVGILFALACLTFRQATIYRDTETLWRDTLTKNPDCWMAHNNLANTLMNKQRLDEAISHCQKALEIKSDYREAMVTLGAILLRVGRTSEAVSQLQRAHELYPQFSDVNFNLGVALLVDGIIDDAISRFYDALRVDPDLVPALEAVAWIRSTQSDASRRNASEALNLAGRAVELTGRKDSKALDILSAALAEAGRFSEAIETGKKAQAIARSASNEKLTLEIANRVELYQLGLPYRTKP